ncbi:TrbI/VirB10 family protein [Brunnivagina elsteri]|uniref:Conjugal transfer protein TrbI n=1 Tax=Brunnivagina elsteri CCALA 953 TaxID=987040 RepID=A0A2A2TD16_9CYAN|nr:TrbI/VirB10 family protein [Calothrix elsteri]PAX51622.1 conjugal transfer protein TrbI [Calothrix elsteri CCALA 953]
MQNLSDENNEQENNWNEESFAKLLGLNDEKNSDKKTQLIESAEVVQGEINNQDTNPIATHELFDDPQLGKTQPTFYGNPFAKFGAVGLVMLVVFGGAATVLNSIMSGKPRIAPTIANREESNPKVEIADNSQATETGKLKAELALSTQAEKIKSVEHSQRPKTQIVRRNTQPQNNKLSPTVVPREIPRNRVTYVARPIPQRVSYNPPHAAYTPRLQPVVNKVNPPSLSKPLPKKEEVNPIEEWREISSLGSYGNVQFASNSKSDSLPNNTLTSAVDEQQTPTIPRATLVSFTSNPNQIVTTNNDSELEPLHDEEASIINNQEIQQLTVGSSSLGKLVTPLIWANNQVNNVDRQSNSKQQSDKFIIQLSKSLKTKDGFVILPKNSQIIVQVKDIQKSGFIELEATGAVIDGNEYLLPANAIAIRGKSGQPLIASKWGDKGGEIASRDAETFAVGSLAKVGKVLNQPKEEQTSTNSDFGGTSSFSSIRRNRSNILGAVLEGGFEPLTQQILQRNQQALQEIQQRENVWYVKAGTEVQVFVNQTFQF